MNRKHDIKFYYSIIEKLKKSNSNIDFSSDFIVGYPEEDDKDFEKTTELVKKLNLLILIHLFLVQDQVLQLQNYKKLVIMLQKID